MLAIRNSCGEQATESLTQQDRRDLMGPRMVRPGLYIAQEATIKEQVENAMAKVV